MRKEKAFLLLQAGVCVALALLLAIGAIGIYAEGSARRAEDPLENIYTAEIVSEKLDRLAPVIFIAVGLLVLGIILGARDPSADRPAKADGPVRPRGEPKHRLLIQTVIVVAAVALIILGILNGSAGDVLVKAINICSECIGLG